MAFADFWERIHAYVSVSGQDRAILFRSLAVAFNSGVPLPRGLDMVSRQAPNPVLAKALAGVCVKVESGRYLSNALNSYPHVFGPLHVRLVAVGEKSGRLGSVLTQIADLEERQTTLHMKIRNSLTMPLIVSSLCVVMVALVPPFLFRGLLEMLQGNGAELPWPTKMLIGMSDAIRSFWFYLIAGPLLALTVWRISSTLRTPRGRVAAQELLLRLPVAGPMLRTLAVTRFAQVLVVLHGVGMPILQCLEASAAASGDPCMVRDMEVVSGSVREGELLGNALECSEFFPATFCHAVRAGEESGGLSDMLKSMSNLYQLDLEHRIEIATKSIEPLMLLFVGSIVCFTVLATLLPLLKVIESL